MHSSFLQSGHASAPTPSTAPMANYPLNIVPYLPPGMTIELGPADRKVRADMVVGPIPPLRHDFLAIAEANRFIPQHQKEALRDTIQGLLHESHYFPIEISDHPLGVGIFGFVNSVVRDTVVGTTFELDEFQAEEHIVISFVPHDAALNMRLTTYGPQVWLLYIGFPHDYQTSHYIHKSVDKFGELITWNNPREDRKVVLIKARVLSLSRVPKSFVMHQLGGARHCWTVCVTILRSSDWNAHIPDAPPAGIDPPPTEGILHPLFEDGLSAEQMYQAQLHNWLAQNAAPNQKNEEVQQGNEVHFQAN